MLEVRGRGRREQDPRQRGDRHLPGEDGRLEAPGGGEEEAALQHDQARAAAMIISSYSHLRVLYLSHLSQ